MFANDNVSETVGCMLKRDVKCNISVFPGLNFNIFLVFHVKTSLMHPLRTPTESTKCLGSLMMM